MSIKHMTAGVFALALAFLIHSISVADSHAKDDSDAEEVRHRLVIQVSTDDPRTQTIALNNAVNLQKHYGIDNIDIEIVAYGPGLGMLTEKSSVMDRVSSLSLQEVAFSACGNTMQTIEKKTGVAPKLIEGVGTVQAGVARIMELQEQGYSYIRP
ncbi:DsrE family protein [Leucothrix pacifica]|nr:DsrE family protein [Leucothrix pacifica]